jgi:hypothetical protein
MVHDIRNFPPFIVRNDVCKLIYLDVTTITMRYLPVDADDNHARPMNNAKQV